MEDRYQGKPLLRLLECYVLWSINELSETEEAQMAVVEPKLRDVYRVQGDWRTIISQVMRFPENMPDLIRELWARNRAIAVRSGATLEPQEFAIMFVDENLV